MTTLGGISICIIPLIVLGVDQSFKASQANQEQGPVYVHHLDTEKRKFRQDLLLRHVDECRRDRNVTVIIFASPQILVEETQPWLKLIPEWCMEHLVKSLFIDEFHLWLEYALTIRTSFVCVSHHLFPHFFLLGHPERHILVCAMSATFSLARLEMFEKLTSLQFNRNGILWAPPADMS